MHDANETADAVLSYLNTLSACQKSGFQGIRHLLGENVVNLDGWRRIDAYETANGQKIGKPREKITSIEEMLQVANRKSIY